MANAKRDNNFIPTFIVALDSDGLTIVPVRVVPSTHALQVSDGATGTNRGPTNALRDENNVPVAMGVSSVDLTTPVVAYGNSSGKLLIQST